MVSMMIEFTSNNHQIERICFNSFIITRQNDDGGREIISMVPLILKLNLVTQDQSRAGGDFDARDTGLHGHKQGCIFCQLTF